MGRLGEQTAASPPAIGLRETAHSPLHDHEDSEPPLVTVVIPAHNEERDVARAIEAVAAQTYPTDRIEMVVVDGASTDETRTVARRTLGATEWHRCVVLHNPDASTPSNLNLGLTEARGTYLCRVDARSTIPEHYVSECVSILRSRPEVAVVGGSQKTVARDDSAVATGIARALNNPVSMGGARYRRSNQAGATDTVYLGAFRAEELREVGGWDPTQRTNQDYELNRRLGHNRIVWFEPSLEVGYTPRPNLRTLAGQYRRFGRWKAAGWLETDQHPALRHLGLLALPPVAATTLALAARRSPAAAAAAALGGLAMVERCSQGRARPGERVVSAVATGLVTGSWWFGTVEQTARRLTGQRLLSDGAPSTGHDATGDRP